MFELLKPGYMRITPRQIIIAYQITYDFEDICPHS